MKKHISLFILLCFSIVCITTSSCNKNSDNHEKSNNHIEELVIDTASYRYVSTVIRKEKERAQEAKVNAVRVRSFDSTYTAPTFLYEYFLDHDSLSEKDFFIELESANIKHFTKTLDWKPIEPMTDESPKTRGSFEVTRIINAYSNNYISSRMVELEHVDLHFSKYDVLYLSLGSSITGDMNAQVYDYDTGDQITSFHSNRFDGSYYIGNGLSDDTFDGSSLHKGIEKIRVVIKIDDQFCFREFKVEDIVADEES